MDFVRYYTSSRNLRHGDCAGTSTKHEAVETLEPLVLQIVQTQIRRQFALKVQSGELLFLFHQENC